MGNYKAIQTVINHDDPNAFTVVIDDKNKFGHNDLVLNDGVCRVAEEVAHLLQHIKGENCLNINTGFDYVQFFDFWNTNRKGLARSMLTNHIMNVRDVIAIKELVIKEDIQNHILRITYTLNTPYGEVKKWY